jgi:sulfoxide reductase heme-binding subunit YedZ
MNTNPADHLFWLSSRAFGVVALGLVALSVGVGLALSGRVVRRPGMPGRLKRAHESLALAALFAIAMHGLLLLGDSYLKPGLAGIAIPFAMSGQPVWTALGIVCGWLTALIVVSFYVRRWIGVRLWRKLHRATVAVYLLGIVHTLGSGTDAGAPWLLALVALTAAPVAALGGLRLMGRSAPWTTTPSASTSNIPTVR